MVSLRAFLPLLVIFSACAVEPAAQEPEKKPEANIPTEVTPEDAKQLTEEEIALIAADPATLTVEQRRKRGYALRKKIMQDPESESAKALEEARQAAMAGEIDPPGKPKDNGVVIPVPEHLKNQDQSYGKPAE